MAVKKKKVMKENPIMHYVGHTVFYKTCNEFAIIHEIFEDSSILLRRTPTHYLRVLPEEIVSLEQLNEDLITSLANDK